MSAGTREGAGISIGGAQEPFKPAIAQLVEHQLVDRCVQLSDDPWFDSGWPDLAWCKHFGIKARQLSWRSFPLASKQSRSSQTGSPNLMSRQLFFFPK